MARAWVKPHRGRGGKPVRGHWRNTGRRRASAARSRRIAGHRVRAARSRAAARRTVAPGSASVEMGVRFRLNRARGVVDHPAMARAGQIKVGRRRRRR